MEATTTGSRIPWRWAARPITRTSIYSAPGGDLAPEGKATRAFLERHGLDWPDEQMMSRFVRTVDPARRHDLIVFYNESIADAGLRLAVISDEGAIRPAFRQVADSLTARSLRAFSILPADDIPACEA